MRTDVMGVSRMNDRTDRNDRAEARSWVTPRTVAALVLVALLVVFWAENRREVKVQFWIPTVTVKVWVALLVAGVAGFVAGFLARGGRD